MVVIAPINRHIRFIMANVVPPHEVSLEAQHVRHDLIVFFAYGIVISVVPNRVEVKDHVDGTVDPVGHLQGVFGADASTGFADGKAVIMRKYVVFEHPEVIENLRPVAEFVGVIDEPVFFFWKR